MQSDLEQEQTPTTARSREALQRSEACLAEAQKLSHTGSFGWNVSTGELFWSDETFRILDCDPTVNPSLEFVFSRIHPDDIAFVKQTLDKATREGTDLDFEHRLLMPDGVTKYVHILGRPAKTALNQVEFIGAIMDVTQRKRSEDELRRSEACLREAQKLSRTGSFRINANTRELICSDETIRIGGWKTGTQPTIEQALKGVHPDDYQQVAAILEQALSDRMRFEFEHRLLMLDGTIRHVHTIANSMHMPSGETEIVGVTMDITEQRLNEAALKKALSELRRSEAYLAEAQRLSRTGSFALRLPSGELECSEEIIRIMGYKPETKVSLELALAVVHPEDVPMVQALLDRARRELTDLDYENRLLMSDKSIKHVHVVARVMRDGADSVEIAGAVMDITERKRAEEVLRKSQAELARVTRLTTMGELAASIAHEVNQPLAAVVTNANACLRWLDRAAPNLDEAREAVQRIVRDGNRGSEVIARIRALLKKGPVQKTRMSVNEAVQEILKLAQTDLRGVTVEMQLANEPLNVIADRVQLQQVLLNLMINALDAMKMVSDRPHVLRIETKLDGDDVLVAVQDSGVGFQPDCMEKLFETFYTTKSEGLGMGLSISRSIIEEHGGRLWAECNQGPGATFRFTLPVQNGGST